MMAAAVFLTAVAGCVGEEQGIADPVNPPGGTSSGQSPATSVEQGETTPGQTSSISSSIDPCDLLSASDLAEVGNFDSKYEERGGVRACIWQNSFKNGGDGFTFGVSVRDSESIEMVNDFGGGIRPEEVNQRPAVSTEDPEFGDCRFAMKIDDLSRVDITVTGEGGCEIAKVIAGLVEPRLPAIS